MVLNRTTVSTQHTEVSSALQDLLLHLIAKTIRQGKRDDQRRDPHTDSENCSYRSRASERSLVSRPKITEGKKYFVRHKVFSREGRKVHAKAQRKQKSFSTL